MANKYVLCPPDAGINDMLCQIELAYRYAEQTNRIVIVDTAYENSFHFHDKFSNYFSSSDPRLILDADTLEASFDTMTVAPWAMSNRLRSYKPVYSHEFHNFADAETGTQLTFDIARHYHEDMLLHHACGGGQKSIFALSKLVLHPKIVDMLKQRIDAIGEPYSAIHIRNTDYQTDYIKAIDQIKGLIRAPVFIATDSLSCRNYCIETFGKDNVRFFSDLPEEETSLHLNKNFNTAMKRNSDSLLDLLTCALSTQFFKISLKENAIGMRYSGFSLLAENLITYDGIMVSLLGATDAADAVFRKAFTWRRQAR